VTAAVSRAAVTVLVFVTVKATIPMPPCRNVPTGLILVVSWALRDGAEPGAATVPATAVAGAVTARAAPAEAGVTGAPGPVTADGPVAAGGGVAADDVAGGGVVAAAVAGGSAATGRGPEAGVAGAAEDGSEREEPGAVR
jgi:hypothetical protein